VSKAWSLRSQSTLPGPWTLTLSASLGEAEIGAERAETQGCLILSGLDLGLMASGLGLIEFGLVASNIYSAHDIN